MKEEYQKLPYDVLCDMASNGDRAASLEMGRRYALNQADGQNGEKKTTRTLLGDEDYRNPDARKPHMWAVFMLWMLWKKICILAEPVAISLLLYAAYYIIHDMYYVRHFWGSPINRGIGYGIRLLAVVLLGKVVSGWLKLAWEKRPLTVWLVIGAAIFWYDGISPI